MFFFSVIFKVSREYNLNNESQIQNIRKIFFRETLSGICVEIDNTYIKKLI